MKARSLLPKHAHVSCSCCADSELQPPSTLQTFQFLRLQLAGR